MSKEKADKPKADLQTGPEAQQTLASSTSNIDPNLTYNGDELISWITENGGYIHPNARIGLDPTGKYRGVFVKTVEEGGTEEGIAEDEVVCRIPWYVNLVFELCIEMSMKLCLETREELSLIQSDVRLIGC